MFLAYCCFCIYYCLAAFPPFFRDGPQETARKLGVFTDGEPNDPPSSTSNQVLIRFRSNTEKGGLFRISYQGLYMLWFHICFYYLISIHSLCDSFHVFDAFTAYRLQYCLPPPIIPNAEILMASKEFKIGRWKCCHNKTCAYKHKGTDISDIFFSIQTCGWTVVFWNCHDMSLYLNN